ncbi:glycoside hydrolase family 13 protein [Microbacterium trichothecenolyticum]|uniref:glycoside hydrolase family 13 protein n=1 Tax=Microbacterium trichothecenolyticum TaxID=69370 RepID=UPI0035BE3025
MPSTSQIAATTTPARGAEWWRSAVIYQIYPRSFADGNGDGIGDIRGITERLGALSELGVDAIWLSPFYPSPQNDAGYDVADYCDVDPIFGTLADVDELIARAHARGIRVIVDLVPNHSSSQHRWFQEALASAPGSVERGRYIFRDGRGDDGELPPNNWQSVFGGAAWTRILEPDGRPGQWYLHLFDTTQPDFDWTNPWVQERFVEILSFWLDRGVDGFRVDVAHGLDKAPDLPDYDATAATAFTPGPYWGRPGAHEVYREWRVLLDTYSGDRLLCAEAWVSPLGTLAQWVRPDEMHQAFNFEFLMTSWRPAALRDVIRDSLSAFGAVGAPSTWVLSNHDVVRPATRLGLPADADLSQGWRRTMVGSLDMAVGLRRARAAALLMLSLPGCAYLYQGEELGLPEVIDIPDDAREDPTWRRTGGERLGRDGCRVPLPWTAADPAFGFSSTGAAWLPQPAEWRELARDLQRAESTSTLRLYQEALRLRRAHSLAGGELTWLDVGDAVLAFRVGEVRVFVNFGQAASDLPPGRVALSSAPLEAGMLPADSTAWLIDEDAVE